MKTIQVVIIVAIFVLIIFLKSRLFKNLIGKIFRFGTCPNCGDSWMWKIKGNFVYTKEPIVLEHGTLTKGLSICTHCLSNHHLNEKNISNHLKKVGWSEEDIVLVREALLEHGQ
jgi:hypothetical protein